MLRMHEQPSRFYRKIKVAQSTTLEDLHYMIQALMGWYNGHLHQFIYYPNASDYVKIINADLEEFEEDPSSFSDEKNVTISEFLSKCKTLHYEYDFGDGWDVEIKCTDQNSDEVLDEPVYLGGVGQQPVEDCGGIDGWEVIKNYCERKDEPATERLEEYFEDSSENILEWMEFQGYFEFSDEACKEHLSEWRSYKELIPDA